MTTLKALISKLKSIKEIRLNRNIITYLICVVIASILWFLNTLNKDYSAELTFPVKYVNFPEGKYPLVKLPRHLQLEVNAKGFALLGYRIKTSFLPITFNVSAYNNHLQKNNDIFEYTLKTNDIKDKIGSQLSTDLKLLNVYPEEIVFKFGAAVHKKVAIRPMIKYTLKRQYILNRLTTIPDSVTVSGPATILDTLQYVETAPLTLKDVGKNVSRSLKLTPIPDCSFKEETADVLLEVEQFTESRKIIAITPLDVPDTINIRLFPPTVSISYEVGLSQYEKVTDNDFIFSVEYPKNADATYLAIKVQKAPARIKNLSFTPQKVEYILEKK